MAISHSDPDSGELAPLLPVLGTNVCILHPLRGRERALGGGDLDCAVDSLDLLWPLRLPRGWRLLQRLHYEFRGWTWILEHGGSVVELDTLDDHHGIGHHGFPTDLALSASQGSLDAVRAAYLTSKRLRKGIRAQSDWEHIGHLAQKDSEAYLSALRLMFGKRVATRLADAVERREPPSESLSIRSNLGLWRRRLRTPRRALSLAAGTLSRVVERIREPTGLQVVIAGPDGAGKSTLAKGLAERCSEPFQSGMRFHWRPGLLPRLGAVLGTPPGDPTLVHERPTHGLVPSLAALAYYWADFFLGYWTRIAVRRIRSGLVVVERGWWDIVVDPRRYRLRAPAAMVRALGHLLPGSDLNFVLEASRHTLLARKQELSGDEVDRQARAWRKILPRSLRVVFLDATRSEAEVFDAARERIFALLEVRTLSRLGSGWATLPSLGRPGLLIPRGPRGVARAALSIYHPVTLGGRIGWEGARLACVAGALRFLPRGPAPPLAVREALASHLPPRANVAVAVANHPGRYIAFIIGSDGEVRAVAKIATDFAGHMALEHEAQALTNLARVLPQPLEAPTILDRAPGLLLLEPIEWHPRMRPSELPEEVAGALGVFFRATAEEEQLTGAAHGDCAPWNLLKSSGGWALVDWEQARPDSPPFFDVFHYVAQSHILLKRRSARELLADLTTARGPVRAALEAYAERAGLEADGAIRSLPDYLEASSATINPSTRSGQAGLKVRRELLRALGSRDT